MPRAKQKREESKHMQLLKEIAKCHKISPHLIVTVSELAPGEGVSPREYKHLFYNEANRLHYYARHSHLVGDAPEPFRARLEDGERIADVSNTPGEVVFLTEKTLTDKSKVYNVLVGNVRFECVNQDAATELFWKLTQEGELGIQLDY